jgi:hypothetical protein
MGTGGFSGDRLTKSPCSRHRLKISRASSRERPAVSIGSPQPRVRRSPSMFPGRVSPKSGAIGAAIVVAVALGLAGGCGGGAQPRKPDAGSKTDGPTGMTQDGGGTDTSHGEAPGIALGQPCTDAAKCGSGICVDGVCCNAACDGACLTCAASGSVGTCVPADIGTNPRNGCTDMGAASCGSDGLCDGTGSCQNYVAGVTCQQPGCTGSTLTFAGRCDGVGTCVTPASQSCAPWTCGSTGACKTTCSADADCTAGNFCVSGSCGLKPPGATCGAGGDCKSGICAQGACCATACTGNCKSCAHRERGDLHERAERAGSAGAMRGRPGGELWPQRLLRRRGRLPALPVDHDLRHQHLHGGHGDPGRKVRRPRRLSGGNDAELRRLRLRHDRRLQDQVRGRRGLLLWKFLHRHGLWKEGHRRDLRRGRRLHLGPLRAGRLLQYRLHGDLHVVRPDHQPWHLHAGGSRRRSTQPVSGRRRHQPLRDQRVVQRRGRLPVLPGGAQLRRRLVHRFDADPGTNL